MKYIEYIKDINPSLDASLMTTLFKLEDIKSYGLNSSTPPWIFFELKEIMHIIESLASARIEGNKTTLVTAAIESVKKKQPSDETFLELNNLRKGIEYIENHRKIADENGERFNIDLKFIRELHKIAVNKLAVSKEGSTTPGKFRTVNVKISNSECVLPGHHEIHPLMSELIKYINEVTSSKLDIIRIAIAHHCFTLIHPFDNGNGRTARLLTYAMLTQRNLIDSSNLRLINPSAIFCINREDYINYLAGADTGLEIKREEWCDFVARGILGELERINRLLDKKFTVDNIILPAVKKAHFDNIISDQELSVIKIAIEKDKIRARDLNHLFKNASAISRLLKSMREREILFIPKANGKIYVLKFVNKLFIRYILEEMSSKKLLTIE